MGLGTSPIDFGLWNPPVPVARGDMATGMVGMVGVGLGDPGGLL